MLKRVVILLILACMIPTISAQTDSSGEVAGEDVYGVIFFDSSQGELVENRDGTYTLTMQGVPQMVPYWMVTPAFMPLPTEILGPSPAADNSSAGIFIVAAMINAWRLNDELYAEGWLVTRDSTVHVLLYEPDHYPTTGELTFTVDVIDVFAPPDAKGERVPPRAFRDGMLSVTLDYELMMGLEVGLMVALDDLRWTCSGTERQLQICECKREAGEMSNNVDDLIAAFQQCNNMEIQESEVPEKK